MSIRARSIRQRLGRPGVAGSLGAAMRAVVFGVWSCEMLCAQAQPSGCSEWFGVDGADGEVWILTHWDPDGPGPQAENLVIAGSFTHIGAVPTPSRVAAWDGSAWRALGAGSTNSTVYALTVHNGELYAGGLFTTAGGHAASRVARWDAGAPGGGSWQPLAGGITGDANTFVMSLVSSGGRLIAGGLFTTAGGQPASNVAAWNGSAWEAMAVGVGGEVRWMENYAGELIIGGNFTSAGAQTTRYLARWNGSAWSEFAGGVNAALNALLVDGDQLYVGGYFNRAGSTFANCVARWDGSAWHSVGAGLSEGVPPQFPHAHTLALYNGELYAGGQYLRAGGELVNHIARWDGAAWHGLSGGLGGGMVGGHCYRLLPFGGSLYVTGDFTAAGPLTVGNIARWRSCPADFSCDGFVDFFDLDAFVGAFEAGLASGDFNGDGFLDFFDFDAFVTAFEAGC